MIDNILKFLEDNTKTSSMIGILIICMFILFVLKTYLEVLKKNTKIFDIFSYLTFILILVIMLGNILANQSNKLLWTLVIIASVLFLLFAWPKIKKWSDNIVDRIVERINRM